MLVFQSLSYCGLTLNLKKKKFKNSAIWAKDHLSHTSSLILIVKSLLRLFLFSCLKISQLQLAGRREKGFRRNWAGVIVKGIDCSWEKWVERDGWVNDESEAHHSGNQVTDFTAEQDRTTGQVASSLWWKAANSVWAEAKVKVLLALPGGLYRRGTQTTKSP